MVVQKVTYEKFETVVKTLQINDLVSLKELKNKYGINYKASRELFEFACKNGQFVEVSSGLFKKLKEI